MTDKLKRFKDRGVRILDSPPAGYRKIRDALTAPIGYAWYCNNESLFGGCYDQVLVKEGEYVNQG